MQPRPSAGRPPCLQIARAKRRMRTRGGRRRSHHIKPTSKIHLLTSCLKLPTWPSSQCSSFLPLLLSSLVSPSALCPSVEFFLLRGQELRLLQSHMDLPPLTFSCPVTQIHSAANNIIFHKEVYIFKTGQMGFAPINVSFT